jgi:hypothetical protein
LASQGFVYEGPQKKIGFKPNYKPQDHKSFFTAAQGWGLFEQKRDENSQLNKICLRWGNLPVKEMVFEVPVNAGQKINVKVLHNGKRIKSHLQRIDHQVSLVLNDSLEICPDELLVVEFKW